jgi:ABC-type siderophore export system fused ATPase/permease subunit
LDENVIEHWLSRLQLSSKVSLVDGAFTTVSLSTGQRKRLAMVSAIAEGRRVMVLDEWAADQDPVFRELFYRELLPELKQMGYTLLVVSHDDRYFDVADRLVSLEQGHLIETSLEKAAV